MKNTTTLTKVPEMFSGYLSKDSVMDGDELLTLYEYNQRHGTKYTLKDIYGEDYIEVPEDTITPLYQIDEDCCHDDLYMPHKRANTESEHACQLVAKALLRGAFNELEKHLCADCRVILHGDSRDIIGKNAVMDYLKEWKEKYADQEYLYSCLEYSNYHKDIVLRIEGMFVFPIMENSTIKILLFVPQFLSPIASEGIGNMLNKTMELQEILKNSVRLKDENVQIHHRIPCFKCYKASDQLSWYKYNSETKYDFSIIVSVCKDCGKVVEQIPLTGNSDRFM